jgi:hypothetical protein
VIDASGRRDPSQLPGSYASRVFVGGSYARDARDFLGELAGVIRDAGFEPVVADEFGMEEAEIHDLTMLLLHSCSLAIFELSRPSGALMEIERTRDYGTRTLILFHDPAGHGWQVSKMLSSFVRENDAYVRVSPYVQRRRALTEVRRWLRALTLYGRGRRV